MTTDRKALEGAWDALGYLNEWIYPGTSDDVLAACETVVSNAFQAASEALGLNANSWPGQAPSDHSASL